MKVALGTIEIDDDTRRLIACYYGDHGTKASRAVCRRWIVSNGHGAVEMLDCDICFPTREYGVEIEDEREGK